MNCDNCGNKLEDGINICPGCGNPSAICTNCGSHNEPDTDYCTECKYPLKENLPFVQKSKTIKKIKEIDKKYIYLAVCSFVVLIAVVLISSIIKKENNNSNNNQIFFIKDKALYILSTDKKSTQKIVNLDISKNDAYESFKVSDNGKMLFYSDSNKSNFAIKYIKRGVLNKSDTIDDGITSYKINTEGTIVYYTKGVNSQLYLSDLKTSTKIDDSVNDYYIHPDGSKVLYSDSKNIYMYTNNSKSIIAENAVIVKVSKYLDEIFYRKENNLYVATSENKEKLILENFSDFLFKFIYNENEIYFINKKGNLIYYNNGNNTNITEYCHVLYASQNKPVIVFKDSDSNMFVACKDKVYKIQHEDSFRATINQSGTKVYFTDNKSALGSYNLYVFDILTGTTELYASDIVGFSILKQSEKCLYYKQGKEDTLDLYLDKTKVASNIAKNFISVDYEANLVYQKTNGKNLEYYFYNGKESIRITEECHSSYYCNKEAIVYAKKVRDDSFDLYLFNGKKSKLIEKNISVLVPAKREYYTSEDYYDNMFGYNVEIVPLHNIML